MQNKKYYIKTFGCQMNVKDSQNMAGVLETLGFIETMDIFKSDVVIINTCSVRQASEDKVYGYGIKFKQMGNKKPLTFITGCMVGSAKGKRSRFALEYLKNKMPWVDYFLAPLDENKLPNILLKEKLIDNWSGKAFGQKDLELMAKREGFKHDDPQKKAFINISYGCDNFCTFCVVPYARGREVSRPKKQIIREVKLALQKGYGEIMLLGQNVNSWNLDSVQKLKTRKSIGDHPFAKLLKQVSQMEGVSNVSFISSNPWDFTPELVETLALPKIDKFLHLAVQSGSNKILKAMNRRHTAEEFVELTNDIKKQVPNIQFGTDIIVGFPGETEKDFQDTLSILKAVKFNVVYVQRYSPRKGTPAEGFLKDNVSLEDKTIRHKKVLETYNKFHPDKK